MKKIYLSLIIFLLLLFFHVNNGLNINLIFSNSMFPTLQKFDLVLSIKENNYEIGDVVTFSKNSNQKKSTTHRIIGTFINNSFKTKGDNNSVSDRVVINKSNIIGKVVFVVRYYIYLIFLLVPLFTILTRKLLTKYVTI